MTDAPRPDDEMDDLWHDFEREFGPRRSRDPDDEPVPPRRSIVPERQQFVPDAERIPPRPPVRIGLPLHRPRAVYLLLTINVALWVLPALLDASGIGPELVRALVGPTLPRIGLDYLLFVLGAKFNDSIYANGEYYRLITATFLHGGLPHIAFNGLALYALGPESERLYGTLRWLAIYLISGLAGSLASYAFNAAPSVGASGAIFGLIGALASFYYLQRRLLGSFAQAQLTNVVGVALINLLLGAVLPNIDNWGHIGGLIGGLLAGLLLTPRFAIDTRFYPPQVVRRDMPLVAWGGAICLLLALILLALTIVPPR